MNAETDFEVEPAPVPETAPRPRRKRRWTTVLSLTSSLVMAVSAGAVSTNKADADRTTPAQAATTTTTVATASPYVVEVADCRQIDQDLRISGSVRNDGDAPTAYRVAITATAPSGEVLLTVHAETEPAPVGESRPWIFESVWDEHDLVAMGATCEAAGVELLAPVGSA